MGVDMMNRAIRKLSVESGFEVFLFSSRDVKILCLQRFFRLLAYGATFVILVQFLSLAGNTDAQTGLFMTLTLLGDVMISLLLTSITDNVGRRRILSVGAALMVGAGVCFTLSSNFWILLVAATFGVISPSGNEIGPFRAVEEAVLAQLVDEDKRSDIFAWYNMFGTGGAALGTLGSGWLVQLLQSLDGWSPSMAYRAVFALYALCGVLKLTLTLILSRAVEVDQRRTTHLSEPDDEELENAGLLGDASRYLPDPEYELEEQNNLQQQERRQKIEAAPPEQSTLSQRLRSYFPHITRALLSKMVPLLILFSLDALASGLASPSWLTYFFTDYHSVSPAQLGMLFFTTNIVATLSNLAALPLARRLGPLKTMVFTHLPSAVFLGLIPVPYADTRGKWIAISFLVLRACTQSMDQAPRQAFIAGAVMPEERTMVLGSVNTAKTLAQAVGTGVAGVLAEKKWWLLEFGGAGVGKALYDLLMLWMFSRQ